MEQQPTCDLCKFKSHESSSVENKTFDTGFPDNLTIETLYNKLYNGKNTNNWKLCLPFVGYSKYSKYCNFKGTLPNLYIYYDGAPYYISKNDAENYKVSIEIVNVSTIKIHITYVLKNDIQFTGNYFKQGCTFNSGTQVTNVITLKQKCKNCL